MANSGVKVTFKGNPLTIEGKEVKPGDSVPDFTVTGTDMSDITINTFLGKVVVICSVPSLDTPICDKETQRFNKELESLPDDVAVLVVSRDLPFAQKRWCGAAEVENVTCASDYKHQTFGNTFGVYAKELGLLARAVFIVDRQGKVAYVEYVPEIAAEPNYDAVIAKVKELISRNH